MRKVIEYLTPSRQVIREVITLEPRIPAEVLRVFKAWVPSYWTCAGKVDGVFRKADISSRDGSPIAYYDIVAVNPGTGIVQTFTVLYTFRNGQIIKLKEFPTRYSAR